jgi:hypothetical protein
LLLPVLARAQAPLGSPPGLAVDQLDPRAEASIGSLNGVRLSIPNYYLLSGVQYKGEEPLSTASRITPPTYDTPIEQFAILIRLSNFQPIKTEQDRRDYRAATGRVLPDMYESWMTVGFDPRWSEDNSVIRNTVENWQRDDTDWGPFLPDDGNSIGLLHMVSTRPTNEFTPKREYFYDANYSTFIVCHTSKQRVAPYALTSRCDHNFLIPEMHARARAIYTTQNLPRWREIEDGVQKVANDFVVH